MSTITLPECVPSVHEDIVHLHKAFEGFGTNEELIISILAHRNAAQRKAIRHAYAEKFGEDLLKVLDKELSSHFEKIVLLWTLDAAERDAYLANEATHKWKPSNQVLVEIVCTRSPKQLILVREAYHARYNKSLEEDVFSHTKGDFRKFLVPLVSSYKCARNEADLTLAKTEAKLLHEKICDKCYADDDVIRILTTRSNAQINATLNQYKHIFGHDIEKDLEDDSKNDFVVLLSGTILCLAYPEKYFERVLHDAISGFGTDEGALTRVVTTRAEIDLKIIKDEYHRKNSVTLEKAITKETHGDYEKMLLALIGHHEEVEHKKDT